MNTLTNNTKCFPTGSNPKTRGEVASVASTSISLGQLPNLPKSSFDMRLVDSQINGTTRNALILANLDTVKGVLSEPPLELLKKRNVGTQGLVDLAIFAVNEEIVDKNMARKFVEQIARHRQSRQLLRAFDERTGDNQSGDSDATK